MKKITLLLFFSLFSITTFAQYRYVIYTDQNPPDKAHEVEQMFLNTAPFNEFEIEFEIRQMPTADLGCSGGAGTLSRLITCDTGHITSTAFESGFDQAIVVTDNNQYGGSGGSIPVISTGTPTTTMLHEYLHTLGFCDEYIYPNQTEADRYCRESYFQNYMNAAIIEPLPEGYSGDEQARALHSGQIPWYSQILPETPIATSNLGTPTPAAAQTTTVQQKEESFANNQPTTIIGLFQSETCREASRNIHLWKPGFDGNIMSGGSNSLDEYVPLVRAALASVIQFSTAAPSPRKSMESSNENCANDRIEENTPLEQEQESFFNNLLRGIE